MSHVCWNGEGRFNLYTHAEPQKVAILTNYLSLVYCLLEDPLPSKTNSTDWTPRDQRLWKLQSTPRDYFQPTSCPHNKNISPAIFLWTRSTIFQCKTKTHHLLTLQVSRWCLLALQRAGLQDDWCLNSLPMPQVASRLYHIVKNNSCETEPSIVTTTWITVLQSAIITVEPMYVHKLCAQMWSKTPFIIN